MARSGAGEPEAARIASAQRRFGLRSSGASPRPLAGDVGGRRYFRLEPAEGLLVLYPAPRSAAQSNWAAIGTALDAAGLRVPALYEDALDLGAALIEDLGDRDLGTEIREAAHEDRRRLLDEAEELLRGVRGIEPAPSLLNPPFDAAFFAQELSLTRHWALEHGGASPLPPERAAEWDALAAALAEAAAPPRGGAVPTHRDFHANNLMRAPDRRLALIDFQDLRLGPRDYDPVSLRFERAGASVECDSSAYGEAVLLQRAWKVLGTFEKMLLLGREVYRSHRDTALAMLSRHTPRNSRFARLLGFVPALAGPPGVSSSR